MIDETVARSAPPAPFPVGCPAPARESPPTAHLVGSSHSPRPSAAPPCARPAGIARPAEVPAPEQGAVSAAEQTEKTARETADDPRGARCRRHHSAGGTVFDRGAIPPNRPPFVGVAAE